MPELPEVETTRRGIEPHLTGRQITSLRVRESRLRWPVPDDLASRIVTERVIAVRRRAKYLLLSFPRGWVLIHLGMSGSLRLLDASTAPAKHDHIDFVLDDGKALRYTDPRRFGAVLWMDKLEGELEIQDKLIAGLGPEPLILPGLEYPRVQPFDGAYLYARSRGKKAPVKTFIMDNHVVVGVGNIYANEALFMAGIRPTREAGAISLVRYKRLAEAIIEVLSRAIEQGGTTLRDFVGGDGKPGYFKQELQVYGRGGLNCRRCERVLKEVRLGQRTTVYCACCQR